jgi:hypothetical protein
MRCAEFEPCLNEVLDQRLWLDANPALAEHVQTCSECRKLAAAYEAVVVGLGETRLPQPSADLTSRVLADVTAGGASPSRTDVAGGSFGLTGLRQMPAASVERRRAGRAPSRSWMAVAAMAAAVLIAVVMRFGAVDPAKPPEQRQNVLAAGQKPQDSALAETSDPADLSPAAHRVAANESPSDRLDPYRGLAAETSDSFAMALQLFPGVGASTKESSDATAAQPGAGWVHGVADGLKPVTRPTAGAVNSFLELLATGERGSRS